MRCRKGEHINDNLAHIDSERIVSDASNTRPVERQDPRFIGTIGGLSPTQPGGNGEVEGDRHRRRRGQSLEGREGFRADMAGLLDPPHGLMSTNYRKPSMT